MINRYGRMFALTMTINCMIRQRKIDYECVHCSPVRLQLGNSVVTFVRNCPECPK